MILTHCKILMKGHGLSHSSDRKAILCFRLLVCRKSQGDSLLPAAGLQEHCRKEHAQTQALKKQIQQRLATILQTMI